MLMKELLVELEEEIAHLNSKSLGPIGFDYRRRTRVERLLFLVAKKFCQDKLNYDLGGLSYTHERSFCEKAKNSRWKTVEVEIAKEAFKNSKLICELTSSDPYTRSDAMEELGGSAFAIFDNLTCRIRLLIQNVESKY